MTRRQAFGLLLAALLLAAGRLVRRYLLVDADGSWREPSLLDAYLPAVSEPEPERTRPALPATPLAINHCSAESLTALPGVGPVLAERIVAEREQHGPFDDPADLQRVKGIGPKLSARVSPFLRFAPAVAGSGYSPPCTTGAAGS